MIHCPKCGFANPDEARFCGSCGGAVAAPPAGPPMPVRPESPPVSSGLKTGIIIGSLIMPLLGIVMGAIYMLDASVQKKAAGKIWLIVGIGAFVLWTAALSG